TVMRRSLVESARSRRKGRQPTWPTARSTESRRESYTYPSPAACWEAAAEGCESLVLLRTSRPGAARAAAACSPLVRTESTWRKATILPARLCHDHEAAWVVEPAPLPPRPHRFLPQAHTGRLHERNAKRSAWSWAPAPRTGSPRGRRL